MATITGAISEDTPRCSWQWSAVPCRVPEQIAATSASMAMMWLPESADQFGHHQSHAGEVTVPTMMPAVAGAIATVIMLRAPPASRVDEVPEALPGGVRDVARWSVGMEGQQRALGEHDEGQKECRPEGRPVGELFDDKVPHRSAHGQQGNAFRSQRGAELGQDGDRRVGRWRPRRRAVRPCAAAPRRPPAAGWPSPQSDTAASGGHQGPTKDVTASTEAMPTKPSAGCSSSAASVASGAVAGRAGRPLTAPEWTM